MNIADDLRSFGRAYPISVFPDPEKEKLEKMHEVFPNLAGRIWAQCGRHLAKYAIRGADELDRLELENERLEESLGEAIVALASYQYFIVANDQEANELKNKISIIVGKQKKRKDEQAAKN